MPARIVPISLKLRQADRLKAVLQAMPVAVSWASLENGAIEFTNRHFDELFGYGPGAFDTVFDFHQQVIASPEQREQARSGVMALLENPPLKEIAYPPSEMEAVRADGSTLTVLLSCSALPEVGAIILTSLDISAQKQAERLAWQLANEDTLTGLPNRRAFDAEVEAAITLGQSFAVFVFDLNGFKAINDNFGHAAGDAVLVEAARRIRSLLRDQDVVSRWGGDEFAALVKAPVDDDFLARIRKRLIEAFQAPFTFEGNSHEMVISAGHAIFPQDGSTADKLTSIADHAMYEEKRAGGTAAPDPS